MLLLCSDKIFQYSLHTFSFLFFGMGTADAWFVVGTLFLLIYRKSQLLNHNKGAKIPAVLVLRVVQN